MAHSRHYQRGSGTEARELMSATANLLKPVLAPVLHIRKDIINGNYCLTTISHQAQTDKVKTYSSVYEAEMAYDNGVIHLQTPIRIFAKGKCVKQLWVVFFNEILLKISHTITTFRLETA